MAAFNYLVTVTTATTPFVAKYAVLEVEATPLSGLSGRYEARLINDPSITKDCDVLGSGIASTTQLTLEFANSDGALNSWLSTDDPRGRKITVHEHEYETTNAPVLVFEGDVKQLSVDLADGEVTLRLVAESFGSGLFDTVLPKFQYASDTFVGGSTEIFGETASVASDEILPENLGSRPAVLIQGSREHIPCLQVKAKPSSPQYVFLVAHDPADAGFMVRGHVNTVYRISSDDGKLRAVTNTSFAQGVVTASNGEKFLALNFSRAQRGQIWADFEAFEFDTDYSAYVKAHWLFRNSTSDQKNYILLQGVTPAGSGPDTALWLEFASGSSLTDQSPNQNNVTVTGTEVFVEDSDGVADGALHNQIGATGARYSSSADADFDFGTGSFHMEAIVKRGTETFGTVDGNVFQKMPAGAGAGGYSVGFRGGSPVIELRLYDTAGSVLGSVSSLSGSSVGDGDWHKVQWEVDRTNSRIRIYIDDALDAEQYYTGVWNSAWTVSNTEGQYVLSNQSGVQQFKGIIDKLVVVSGLLSDDYFVTGASGQSSSAFLFPQTTRLSVPSTNSKNSYLEPDTDLVIMFWAKFPPASGIRQVCDYGGSGSTGYRVRVTGADKIQFTVSGTTVTSTASVREDDGTASPYNWNQVWCIFDASTQIRIVINGVEESFSVNITPPTASGQDFNISDATNDLDGVALDEFMFATGSGAADGFTADKVRTQYMNAIGNPARIMRNLLSNSTFGLGQTVDATASLSGSFDLAEVELESHGIRLKGAVYGDEQASVVFEQMLSTYGMYLDRSDAKWALRFAWQNPDDLISDGATELGYLDDRLNNVGSVSGYSRLEPEEVPKKISVDFFYVNIADGSSELLYFTDTLSANASIDPGQGAIASGADILSVEMPYVRDWEVADRIRQFYRAWLSADRRLTLDEAADEVRGLNCGSKIAVDIPSIGVSQGLYRIASVKLAATGFSYDLREDAVTDAHDWDNNKTTEVVIIQPDSRADYRYTRPPPPEDLHVYAFEVTDAGVITTIRWTMPTGVIADELIELAAVRWQRYTTSSDEGATDEDWEWQTALVPVSPGQTADWAIRELVTGWTYNIEVKSVTPYLWSTGAVTTELGLTAAEFQPGDTVNNAGHAGVSPLKVTIPASSELPTDHPNYLKTDPSQRYGFYGTDQRIAALEGVSVALEQLAVSSNTVTLTYTPNTSPNTPVMIVNGMPYLYTTTQTSRGYFQVSGTTVTLQGGGAPDDTPVIAIYTYTPS